MKLFKDYINDPQKYKKMTKVKPHIKFIMLIIFFWFFFGDGFKQIENINAKAENYILKICNYCTNGIAANTFCVIIIAIFFTSFILYTIKKRPFYHQPEATQNHKQTNINENDYPSYVDECWNEMLKEEKHNSQ